MLKKRSKPDAISVADAIEKVEENISLLYFAPPVKKHPKIEHEKPPAALSKYDHICIMGVFDYDENGETEEEREYIQYGMTRVSEKYKNKKIPYSCHLYDFDRNNIPNLSHLTSSSKIILIGHGGINEYKEFAFAGKEADHLAEILFEDCELSSICAIEFISCNLADSDFIEKFKKALPEEQEPVIIAYTKPLKMGFSGNLFVDLGECDGIVAANQFKLKI